MYNFCLIFQEWHTLHRILDKLWFFKLVFTYLIGPSLVKGNFKSVKAAKGLNKGTAKELDWEKIIDIANIEKAKYFISWT